MVTGVRALTLIDEQTMIHTEDSVMRTIQTSEVPDGSHQSLYYVFGS